METLTKLFGNVAKVKVIKLFVFNTGSAYDIAQIADRTKESISKVRKEVNLLEKMDLVRRKSFHKNVTRKVRGKKQTVKVKTSGFILNDTFEHLSQLSEFLIGVSKFAPKDIARKLSRSGSIKLIIVAGTFINSPESRLDLLVVGDNIKKGMLEQSIKIIESEMGMELRYAFFETADFKYRLGLYDKLLRDVLDFPHEKVVNKLMIS